MDDTMKSDAWHDVDEEAGGELAVNANVELEGVEFTL